MIMAEKEYIIFCDESDVDGRFYSNFYGGVMVGASQYDRITARLNAAKQELNLFGEVKWSKVSAQYLTKYEGLMREFFSEVAATHARVRIMFRQNAHRPVGLTMEQTEGAYFRLYYQFIKHAFGLSFHPPTGHPVRLKLFFDEFPETKEATTQFKGYILGLKDNPAIHRAGLTIGPEDIAEIRSHDHVLAQCLDVVLGAMAFRLNDRHKDIPRVRNGGESAPSRRRSSPRRSWRTSGNSSQGSTSGSLREQAASRTNGGMRLICIGGSCQRRWNTAGS